MAAWKELEKAGYWAVLRADTMDDLLVAHLVDCSVGNLAHQLAEHSAGQKAVLMELQWADNWVDQKADKMEHLMADAMVASMVE